MSGTNWCLWICPTVTHTLWYKHSKQSTKNLSPNDEVTNLRACFLMPQPLVFYASNASCNLIVKQIITVQQQLAHTNYGNNKNKSKSKWTYGRAGAKVHNTSDAIELYDTAGPRCNNQLMAIGEDGFLKWESGWGSLSHETMHTIYARNHCNIDDSRLAKVRICFNTSVVEGLS
jgi:hypothetical protein